MTTPAPKLRWYQYSLRTLLLFVTLCAVPCSWLAVKMQQARRQRAAVAAIERQAGLVFYDYQVDESGDIVRNPGTPGPSWLRDLLGDDCFKHVVQVSLGNGGIEHVAVLSTLERLNVSCPITDGDLLQLDSLTQLRELNLAYTQITDAGLQHLAGLSQLKVLLLDGTKVTDEGVKKLQQALPNCRIDWEPPTPPAC